MSQYASLSNLSDLRGRLDGSIGRYIAHKFDVLDFLEQTDQSPAATIQRAQTITDSLGELLGKLGCNEFEGALGRLASNLTISGLCIIKAVPI